MLEVEERPQIPVLVGTIPLQCQGPVDHYPNHCLMEYQDTPQHVENLLSVHEAAEDHLMREWKIIEASFVSQERSAQELSTERRQKHCSD